MLDKRHRSRSDSVICTECATCYLETVSWNELIPYNSRLAVGQLGRVEWKGFTLKTTTTTTKSKTAACSACVWMPESPGVDLMQPYQVNVSLVSGDVSRERSFRFSRKTRNSRHSPNPHSTVVSLQLLLLHCRIAVPDSSSSDETLLLLVWRRFFTSLSNVWFENQTVVCWLSVCEAKTNTVYRIH